MRKHEEGGGCLAAPPSHNSPVGTHVSGRQPHRASCRSSRRSSGRGPVCGVPPPPPPPPFTLGSRRAPSLARPATGVPRQEAPVRRHQSRGRPIRGPPRGPLSGRRSPPLRRASHVARQYRQGRPATPARGVFGVLFRGMREAQRPLSFLCTPGMCACGGVWSHASVFGRQLAVWVSRCPPLTW